MQDLAVAQDLTVRDSAGNIIQFMYGDDGIDPAKSDHGLPVDLDALLLKAQALEDLLASAYHLCTNATGAFFFRGIVYPLGDDWRNTRIQVSLDQDRILVRTVTGKHIRIFFPSDGVLTVARPVNFF